MSAHCSLRLHSPLKTVFGKIGDTYQAYCNTFKTHAVATHYAGSAWPLDRDIDVTRETQKTADTNIEDTQDFNTVVTLNEPEEIDHCEDLKYNHPTKLTALTREIDEFRMSSGWGRTAHRNLEPHRIQTTETLYSTSSTSTD